MGGERPLTAPILLRSRRTIDFVVQITIKHKVANTTTAINSVTCIQLETNPSKKNWQQKQQKRQQHGVVLFWSCRCRSRRSLYMRSIESSLNFTPLTFNNRDFGDISGLSFKLWHGRFFPWLRRQPARRKVKRWAFKFSLKLRTHCVLVCV